MLHSAMEVVAYIVGREGRLWRVVGEDDWLDLSIRWNGPRNVEIDSLVQLSLCPCRRHSVEHFEDSLVRKVGSVMSPKDRTSSCLDRHDRKISGRYCQARPS